MAVKEGTLSKAEIDDYIRLNYQPDDNEFDEINKSLKKTQGIGNSVKQFKRRMPIVPFLILDKIRDALELSFSEKLMELIREKGKKPAEIYKKANVTKETFSKIKCDKKYHPEKDTAIALAIALHLNEVETQDLIGRAGYTLSKSTLRDLIILFYIQSATYNIDDINEKLMDYDFFPLTNKKGV